MSTKRKSNGGSSVSSLKPPHRAAQQDLRRNTPVAPSSPQAPSQPARNAELPRVSEVKTQPRHEDIARAAYLRWLREGGDPATNWLAAEAELTGRAALKL